MTPTPPSEIFQPSPGTQIPQQNQPYTFAVSILLESAVQSFAPIAQTSPASPVASSADADTQPKAPCTNPHKSQGAAECTLVHALEASEKTEALHETPCGAMGQTTGEQEDTSLRILKSSAEPSSAKESPENMAKQAISEMKCEITETGTTPAQNNQNDGSNGKAKPRRKPFCHLDSGNYHLPIYKRHYKTRPNNQPTYILAFENAETGKPDQISNVSLPALKAEGEVLIANGFVTPEEGGEGLTVAEATKYRGLLTASKGAGATPEELIQEALAVRKILGNQNALVAARFFTTAMQGGFRPTRVGVVVQQYLAYSKSQERGKTYLEQMRYLLARFARYFRKRMFHDITAAELQHFFAELGLKPDSLRAYRGLIKTMSKFGQMRGFVPQNVNPQIYFILTNRCRRPEIHVIKPKELRVLLENVFTLDQLLYVVLGCFAGIRTCEIREIDWSAFTGEVIYISRDVAKSGTFERYIPIQPVLAAWIAPFLKPDGRVVSADRLAKILPALYESLGLSPKRNWFRHGFASFRVAITKNKEKTTCELGHTEFVFHRHYFSAQHEALAKEYFALFPPPDWATRWQEIFREREQAFRQRLKTPGTPAEEAA